MVDHWQGGPWTDIKLSVLQSYLSAWAKVFQNQGNHFTRIYIDAFAGTGARFFGSDDDRPTLIEDSYDPKSAGGSARRALSVIPAFDRFYFVEKSAARFKELSEALSRDFPQLRASMRFLRGDANQEIAHLCESINWKRSRAVLFLDPFGMQVDWATIETIARTEAIDLWYLVPTAIGIGRTLVRSGSIPSEWENRLDRMLGTDTWRTEWYESRREADLFSQSTERIERTASLADIENWFLRRLDNLFQGGAAKQGRRIGQNGKPMYLLTFACANRSPKAQSIALKIASSVLKQRNPGHGGRI